MLIVSDCSKITIPGRSIKHMMLVDCVPYDYVIYRERLGAAKGKQNPHLLIVDLEGI